MTAALALTSSSVLAGGLNEAIQPATIAPVAVAPAPVAVGSDWSGLYVGGSLGYGQVEADSFADDTEGALYGIHGGYLYDMGALVLGGELEYELTDISDSATGIDFDSIARAKVRAGYDAGALLPYATAGFAQAYTSGALDADDTGYFAGLGVDYQVTPNLRVGAEVLRHQFDDFNGGGTDIEATTASLRVGYSF